MYLPQIGKHTYPESRPGPMRASRQLTGAALVQVCAPSNAAVDHLVDRRLQDQVRDGQVRTPEHRRLGGKHTYPKYRGLRLAD